MNEIIKFTDYKIYENVIIPVVDAVISNSGSLNTKYNTNELPLKGNVELGTRVKTDKDPEGNEVKVKAKQRNNPPKKDSYATEKFITGIKGLDGEYYPGGLDKNGNLVGVNFDDDGFLLTLGATESRTRIPIDPDSRSKISDRNLEFWKRGVDYIKCVPNISTGWVNVKVDMEVIKRIRRYSAGLVRKERANDNNHSTFVKKLRSLDRISNSSVKVEKVTTQTIQKQMSAIILLHYINEIKNFFTPSAAGLLFESFIGGLIPLAKVTEDNGKADITVPTAQGNFEYQVKLYSNSARYIDISLKGKDEESIHPNGEVPLDYYLICIKNSDNIVIYILDSNPESPGYYSKFRTSGSSSGSKTFSLDLLNKSDLCLATGTKFILSLINLEDRIKNLGEKLKLCLDELYDLLSKFQYNVETIVTGVDKDGLKVSDADFQKYSTTALSNVEDMKSKLNALIEEVRLPSK